MLQSHATSKQAWNILQAFSEVNLLHDVVDPGVDVVSTVSYLLLLYFQKVNCQR